MKNKRVKKESNDSSISYDNNLKDKDFSNKTSNKQETIRIKIKIPREEIVFLDMIFKSYGGLALVTVDHVEEGRLFLDVTEGTKPDVMAILEDLQERIPLSIYDD